MTGYGPKFARRTDDNHAEVREAMRECGLKVLDLSGMGRGMPDTLCKAPDGRIVLVEIKNPDRKWKLTPAQEQFFEAWGDVVVVIESIEQAQTFARGMLSAPTL